LVQGVLPRFAVEIFALLCSVCGRPLAALRFFEVPSIP
jgi:hypothetical protein